MSKTPLIDTLSKLNHHRYHMPGHKGITPDIFRDAFKFDFTEIDDTGNLYERAGVIAKSEKMYAKYFGAKEIMYMTNGTTGGIFTSILTAKPNKVLVDRNCHKSVCNALSTLKIDCEFVNYTYNFEYNIPFVLDVEDFKRKLEQDNDIDVAIITSPNYYGVMSDVSSIYNICKIRGVTLIVDEAHGAHLNEIGFLGAIKQGADFAVTSMHKTTQALGQSAILMTKNYNENLRKNASIFCTSSPSYLIMASTEYALSNIHKYAEFKTKCVEIKKNIAQNTQFLVLDGDNIDTTRLTINISKYDIKTLEIMHILKNKYKIVPEMFDLYNIVFILTPDDDIIYLQKSIILLSKTLKQAQKIALNIIDFTKYEKKLKIFEAQEKQGEMLPLEQCVNRISKQFITPYPPGVPIVYPGEIIFENHIEYIKKMCYNDYIKINIVK